MFTSFKNKILTSFLLVFIYQVNFAQTSVPVKVNKYLTNVALHAERSKTQLIIYVISAAAISLLALVIFSKYKSTQRLTKILQQKNSLIAEQKKKMEELNSRLRLKILQSKLNPHFIFNSLNAIQYHINISDKKEALKYMSQFSNFLRKILNNSDEILIKVSEEASLAENYLWLEQHRFNNLFSYHINVSDGTRDLKTPPMLVHHILQDALYKHIINTGNHVNLHLQLDFVKDETKLLIRLTDTGMKNNLRVTSTETPGLPGNGAGILLDRINAVNHISLYPVQLNFEVTDKKNIAEIIIPQPLFKV